MATMLNDDNIKRLFDTVIANADESCLRPNSYVLRLGKHGEFLTTGKEFEIGEKDKRGIIIQPGHSVGITALEDIDFSRETVQEIFPGHDLHAFLSPTTDLAREGIVAPTTQIDAGYHGTLNWTIMNNSGKEAQFTYREKIYRMTIFKLEKGETPDALYSGDYQNQLGYVGSRRKGPPVGMKASQWVHAATKGGPEEMLDQLIKFGYPWNVLGHRLKEIDKQFKVVTEEYSSIHDSIKEINTRIDKIDKQQATMKEDLRNIIREEISSQLSLIEDKWSLRMDSIEDKWSLRVDSIQDKWTLRIISLIFLLFGLGVSIASNDLLLNLFKMYGGIIGPLVIFASIALFYYTGDKTKQQGQAMGQDGK